ASKTPEMLDAYQLYRQSPDALKDGMLAAEATRVFSGLSRGEARNLLPMALGVLAQALDDTSAVVGSADPGTEPLDQVEVETLSRTLHLLLATARSRGDISAVLAVLDGLSTEKREYFKRNPEIVKLVAEEDIASFEVTSWAYRKRQMQI